MEQKKSSGSKAAKTGTAAVVGFCFAGFAGAAVAALATSALSSDYIEMVNQSPENTFKFVNETILPQLRSNFEQLAGNKKSEIRSKAEKEIADITTGLEPILAELKESEKEISNCHQ